MIHTTERMPGNGLTIHVHRFGPSGDGPDSATVLLLHGFLDAGGTWTAVARGLVARGLHVVAPDLRGFGRSDRVSGGGYYHFADYVADTHALVQRLDCGDLTVVGHSMGGTVACYYAGTMPEQVRRLVLMEGVGPPGMTASHGPDRMRRWLNQLQSDRKQSELRDLEAAVERLAIHHKDVPRSMLYDVAEHLTVEREGRLQWAYDPWHRTTSPTLFRGDTFDAFLRRITCPVMFVSGGEEGFHPTEETERLRTVGTSPAVVEVAGAGHMMHWTQPKKVADIVADFVADDS